MNPIFEYSDTLNNPYEAFFFDAQKNNFPVSPHWHYFMEILYITRGTALMYQNEQSYIVTEGDMIVFLPSVVHSVHAVSDAPLQYYVLKFDLSQLDSSASLTGGSWNYSALFNNAILCPRNAKYAVWVSDDPAVKGQRTSDLAASHLAR